MTARPSLVVQKGLSQASHSSASNSTPYGPSLPSTWPEFTLKGVGNEGGGFDEAGTGSHARARGRHTRSALNIAVPHHSEAEADRKAFNALDGQAFTASKPPARGKPDLRFPAHATGKEVASYGQPKLLGGNISLYGDDSVSGKSPPPMPVRPGRFLRPQRLRLPSLADPPTENEAIMKPYALEAPSLAPHFPGDGYADFFPWTRFHPEDALSEQVIRQGFFDKHSGSQNEQQSARSSLWPILKHKGGLHVLSSSIVSVLERRQALGRIVAPWTFKPPPRVTLTDTKRRAWLRDLANPTIPLRRLSRTIPHSIRGRVLLEHCVNKSIPAARAIWLIKCVGANEMRASKRKGTGGTFAIGGEVKWVRDWTASVEQFVEHVLRSCGADGWKTRMSYIIRLSAHLFEEQLLDQEHFLDWLLQALKAASVETLPVWLLIAQPYASNLVRYRRSGTRFMAILLEKLHAAKEAADQDVLAPLVQRLSQLVGLAMSMKPANLVSQKVRSEHYTTLQTSLDSSSRQARSTLNAILTRYNILSARPTNPRGTESAKRRLLYLLDSLGCDIHLEALSNQCLALLKDRSVLTQALLDWSTTVYRVEVSRVYLAARLIRKWNREGIDTDSEILSFLGRCNTLDCSKGNVYLLISELTRSRHFSVGRYLQWLIACGAVDNLQASKLNDHCEVRLLAEIPSYNLPLHLTNVRRTLLRKIGAIDEEEDTLLEAKTALSVLIPEVLQATDGIAMSGVSMTVDSALEWISGLSRTIKSDLSRWIRHQVGLYLTKGDASTNQEYKVTDEMLPLITLHQFNLIKSILEHMQDFSILADVMLLISRSDDVIILSAVADTLSYHCMVFGAIGALQRCFERLLERYQSLKGRKLADNLLLRALADLASQLPSAQTIASQLQSELLQSSLRSAVAAYSPVSDQNAEVSQSADSDFSEDIERLLSSGSSIDKHTLARLFGRITSRMEGSWESSASEALSLGNLLAQLRSFDVKVFDELMSIWIDDAVQSKHSAKFFDALPSMITAGCLDLSSVTACSAKNLGSITEDILGSAQVDLAIKTLRLFASTKFLSPHMVNQEIHRFQFLQWQFAKDHPLEWLAVLRRALESLSLTDSTDHVELARSLLSDEAIVFRLRTLIIHNTKDVCDEVMLPLSKIPGSILDNLKHILDPSADNGSSKNHDNNHMGQVSRILQTTNNLSLPFYQLRLFSLFRSLENEPLQTEESNKEDILNVFFNEMERNSELSSDILAGVIQSLENDVSRQINKSAQERFLKSLMFPEPPPHVDTTGVRDSETKETITRKYLAIIQSTAPSLPQSLVSEMGPTLITKSVEFIHGLTHQSLVQKNSSRSYEIHVCLTAFLRLILIYKEVSHPSKVTSTDQARIAISLYGVLLCESLRSDPPLLEFCFDVIARLVDDLPEETRTQCAHFLKDKTTDSRIRYLFGSHGALNGMGQDESHSLYITTTNTTVTAGQPTKTTIPFQPRQWELLSEPTPVMGENDTSLSLRLFGARRS